MTISAFRNASSVYHIEKRFGVWFMHHKRPETAIATSSNARSLLARIMPPVASISDLDRPLQQTAADI